MKHEPDIFDEGDPAAEAASLARARADVEAGRVHSHAVVSEWLGTWSSPDYMPFHQWLAARDG